MTGPVRTYGRIGELKTVITSVTATGARSPEEALETLGRLDRLGIESFVTEEGDLYIKSWTIGAENFVSPEHAAVIRSKRRSPEHGNELDWLSKNLADIQPRYVGQWIAIYANAVVAANPTLHDLLGQIAGIDGPFITFIPTGPVVWKFTYAHQEL
jgi:hypothetical protein